MYQYLTLLALAFPAFAQNPDYLNTIAQALQRAGLTSLASAAARLTNTTTGQTLLNRLPNGNFTLFAPDNEAFTGAPDAFASDDELVARVLSYHIVSGNFTSNNGSLESQIFPNSTVGRTLLNNSSLVQLEGNKSQVLVWTKVDNTVQILNQTPNITVQNSLSAANLFINVINGILTIPLNTSTVLNEQNLTSLSGIFNTTNATDSSGANVTVAKIFNDEARGFTLFAPSNEALQAVSSSLTPFAGNNTAIYTLLGNHVINGSSLYSPVLLSSPKLTTAAGEPLTFTSNSSGVFVVSGISSGSTVATAKVVKSDVLVKNGVIHIIDGVLLNLDTNPEAATSAFNSATSVAAVTSTETGPVGPTSTSSLSSDNSDNAAQGVLGGVKETMSTLVTALVGMLGWTALGVALV
ncbi:FAS1 domain-containing protein [Hymenopellis radicata]|nr:FAS1 domain-containing protein [Hymenopellis radicata]